MYYSLEQTGTHVNVTMVDSNTKKSWKQLA